tara:strand:+ start:6310 stop:8265 length:1956 start_codon:yes stop_codon:yes gene_type:complete
MTKAKKKTPASKKSKKSAPKSPSLLARAFKWLFILGIWGLVFLSGVVLWFAKDLPDVTQSATFSKRASIVIMASDGTEIARYGETKGETIDVADLPPYLPQAVMAIEDRRFYDHPGIDIWGISRAMMTNIYRGHFVQGGSTITQQLAKNLFLTHERKITRKIKEAILALWLERKLTKNEIFSAYMNRVYLGAGTYGFEAAAQLYFGKSAKDVNLREAAVLAGLLKAPSKYSPHNNPKLAKERSDLVLSAMVDAGYIKQSDITDQELKLTLPNKKTDDQQAARYFADWIMNGLDEVIGTPDMDIVVETTLDAKLQNKAQETLTRAIDSADKMQFVSQGGILVMKPDGAVLTMVGGYDYGQSQFNRVTQAKRPPGSAFKPIVYLTALEKGWHKQDEILDARITEGEYRPKNFGDTYYGPVDLETAMTKSMNTATVRLAKDVGIGNVMETARRVGIISDLNRDLSLALGSSGISMLEMGIAYSTFANGGFQVFPYGITRISTQDGRVIYNRKQPKSYVPIIARDHNSELSIMLQSVVDKGTGKNAKQFFPVHGKTGTSQDNRDAWFAGYTDRMVAVVWLGNDDNSPMRRITGGGLPARIFKDVVGYGNARQTPSDFPTNDNTGSSSFSNLIGKLLKGGEAKQQHRSGNYSNLND